MQRQYFFLKTSHPTLSYISLFFKNLSRYSLYRVVNVPQEADFILKQVSLSEKHREKIEKPIWLGTLRFQYVLITPKQNTKLPTFLLKNRIFYFF